MSGAEEADIHGTMFFGNGTRKEKRDWGAEKGSILRIGTGRLQVTWLLACVWYVSSAREVK